jgi:leucyl aminopeptidase
MTLSVAKKRRALDALVLPFWKGEKGAEPACPVEPFASLLAVPLEAGDFLGKEGETLLLYRTPGKGEEKRLILLGLGDKRKATLETLRRAYAAAIKLCRSRKSKSVNIFPPEGAQLAASDSVQALLEGVLLANYAFQELKGVPPTDHPSHPLEEICLVGGDKRASEAARRIETLVAAVNFARDLVNRNADDVTPQALSAAARALSKELPAIKTTVLNKQQIEKEQMGLLLAVNRGSDQEPAFIIMEYTGDPRSKERTALIGKGVTFDTGGLNLKPTGSMETMKSDMAGAAAILGTMKAAVSLGVKANLIGVIAATENAIGAASFKPGDVYRSHDGQTVEIANTDAEGRLILADALSYVQKHLRPTRLIDLATLTGAIVVALGEGASGLFSNDDALASSLSAAGERTQERVWRFPLYADYQEELKSSLADLKNCGSRKASSITAALFLEKFVKGIPWAHLDIAGTAYLSEPKHYHPTVATGVGVRLLIEFLEQCRSC